jgi:hypothetical protein
MPLFINTTWGILRLYSEEAAFRYDRYLASRQGMFRWFEGLDKGLATICRKESACFGTSHGASDIDFVFSGPTERNIEF